MPLNRSTIQKEQTFSLFEMLLEKDILTAQHCLNVACLAKTLTEHFIDISLESERAFITGLMHDVGKINMPDYIFTNYVIESQEDRNIIMQHPAYSKTILAKNGFDTNIVKAVFQHHERFDGSGYPSGLKEFQIIPSARLLGIIDSFAAITEDRTYRKGVSIKKAVDLLFKDKKLYDQQMLNIFLENISSVVQLSAIEFQNFQSIYGLKLFAAWSI